MSSKNGELPQKIGAPLDISWRVYDRAMKLAFAVVLLALCTCPGAQRPAPPPAFVPLVDDHLVLLVTPSPEGHQPFIRAIDGAHRSIAMTMFHLTDEQVVDALVRAAQRGVDTRVIVDGKSLTSKGASARSTGSRPAA